MNYFLGDETFNIRGCLFKVYNTLGCGFLEKVYQEAIEIEFKEAGIPYKREARLQINYNGHVLTQEYIADFLCYDKIIIEVKAVSQLNEVHMAQVFNYLKATNLDLGLLVNFGEKSLKVERIFNINKKSDKSDKSVVK